jgi:uncharacterized phage protein (TIGR02220 family)
MVGRGQRSTSIKALSEQTGITEKAVRTRIKRLVDGGEIVVKTANKFSLITVVNYDSYQNEVGSMGKQRANKGQTEGKQRATNNNDKNDDNENKEPKTLVVKHDVEEVITFLNTTTGSKYKSSTKATVSKIEARIKDGFSVDDIKTVITVKSKEWKGTDMAKYLRPSTLFAPDKFEDYLNQLEQGNNSKQLNEGGYNNYSCT